VDTEKPDLPTQPPDSGWNRYNVTAFIAAGASVLLLGTAAFFAAEAASESDDVNRLVSFRDQHTQAPDRYSAVASQYEQAMADGPRHDRYAKAALIAAAGTAVVSAAFFVLDAKLGKETDGASVSLTPAPGLGLVGGWSLRF
jgi:hypothetical protein